MSNEVILTTVVRDYQSGGQSIFANGYLQYVKYSVEANQDDVDDKPVPSSNGYDQIWFDIYGCVSRIETHDGIVAVISGGVTKLHMKSGIITVIPSEHNSPDGGGGGS